MGRREGRRSEAGSHTQTRLGRRPLDLPAPTWLGHRLPGPTSIECPQSRPVETEVSATRAKGVERPETAQVADQVITVATIRGQLDVGAPALMAARATLPEFEQTDCRGPEDQIVWNGCVGGLMNGCLGGLTGRSGDRMLGASASRQHDGEYKNGGDSSE